MVPSRFPPFLADPTAGSPSGVFDHDSPAVVHGHVGSFNGFSDGPDPQPLKLFSNLNGFWLEQKSQQIRPAHMTFRDF